MFQSDIVGIDYGHCWSIAQYSIHKRVSIMSPDKPYYYDFFYNWVMLGQMAQAAKE